jgi:hypothetical protein
MEKRKIDKLNKKDSSTLLKMVETWINMKDPNKKEWSLPFDKSKYWGRIAKWTSIESAKKCYQHLLSQVKE